MPVFHPASPHGHCEEGHGPDAAIRPPLYPLFFPQPTSCPRIKNREERIAVLASPSGGSGPAGPIGVCITVERSMTAQNPSGSADPPPLEGAAKERHRKPSPWGKVPAAQADEGPRKTNTAHIYCAVPHPALSGHPPPRGGLSTSSLLPLHSSLFPNEEAKERGNGFPRVQTCTQVEPRLRRKSNRAETPFGVSAMPSE